MNVSQRHPSLSGKDTSDTKQRHPHDLRRQNIAPYCKPFPHIPRARPAQRQHGTPQHPRQTPLKNPPKQPPLHNQKPFPTHHTAQGRHQQPRWDESAFGCLPYGTLAVVVFRADWPRGGGAGEKPDPARGVAVRLRAEETVKEGGFGNDIIGIEGGGKDFVGEFTVSS
jgi:hypothetical protein